MRIRTLVHSTTSSTPLLAYGDPNYLDLTIYHQPGEFDHPQAVFVLKQAITISGTGMCSYTRGDSTESIYKLVPLRQSWTEEYLVIGNVRSSKKQIVLDMANKYGGAHVDSDVPPRHVVASTPPVVCGVQQNLIRPNLARATVAQAGDELRDCIERHFPSVK